MRVCYFGTYDEEDPRNKVIIKGLKSNNIEIIECHSSLFKVKYQWVVPLNYINLIRKFVSLRKKYDVVIVGFSMIGSFIDVFLVKLLTKKKIILNPLVSLYGTLVTDRKIIKNFILSRMIHGFERVVYTIVDVIMVDTFQNMHYICRNFYISESKCKRVLVSADTSLFYPRKEKDDDCFTAIFWGGHDNPLHGIKYIVKAGHILESYKDIRIIIAGKHKISSNFNQSNVQFVGFVKDLQKLINEADVCLGIFGGTEKAMNVIPNKVYESLAMKKAVITGKSSAVGEVLTDRRNVILCEMANAESLASSILLLRENKELREKIALEGYRLFIKHLTPEKVGEDIKTWL